MACGFGAQSRSTMLQCCEAAYVARCALQVKVPSTICIYDLAMRSGEVWHVWSQVRGCPWLFRITLFETKDATMSYAGFGPTSDVSYDESVCTA